MARNASANGTYVYSKGGNATIKNGSFPGGFAPKCRGAQDSAYAFRYVDGDWKCSYPTAGQGEITVNFFQPPPKDGEYYAGFQINWSEMQEWSAAFPTPPEGTPLEAEKSAYPVKVRAQCWLGAENNRPGDLSKVANITRSVEDNKHLQMATELPLRSGVDADLYSCIFGFKQRMKGDYNPRLEEKVTVVNRDPVTGEYLYSYYFMTGTNTQGSPIRVRPGKQLEVTLSELQTYAGNTGNITAGTDPWQNFPYQEFSPEGGARKWHPAQYYCKEKYPDAPGCN